MLTDRELRGSLTTPLTGLRRRMAIAEDVCPECGGPLDTGWECLGCGFDAAKEALDAPQLERSGPADGSPVN